MITKSRLSQSTEEERGVGRVAGQVSCSNLFTLIGSLGSSSRVRARFYFISRFTSGFLVSDVIRQKYETVRRLHRQEHKALFVGSRKCTFRSLSNSLVGAGFGCVDISGRRDCYGSKLPPRAPIRHVEPLEVTLIEGADPELSCQFTTMRLTGVS